MMSIETLKTVNETTLKQEILSELSLTTSINSGENSKIQNEKLIQANSLIQSEASSFVDKINAMDFNELKHQLDSVSAVEEIGIEIQKQSAKQSELLLKPITNLATRAQDGGEVANALIDLKMTVESLDPSNINFEPGWFSRLLGHIPGLGNTLKRYVTKFESAQTVINSIVRSLEQGREQLLRDNITLHEDQKDLWATAKLLEQKILISLAIDKELESRIENAEHAKFIRENILFFLRQRLIDMQQQLAVQQQSIIATEIIIRNNKELVRGINRALNVTITALQCATTIAMALAHQQQVLDKVESINSTTSKLISGTAERLKTQGTQIHKQAASAQINIQALKGALNNLNLALDDLSSFRENSLPQMSNTINELNSLIEQTHSQVKRSESLNQ
jgi:uncharacterized protein YaaN involved in tellurite resistance